MRLSGAGALDAVAHVASVNNAAIPHHRLAAGYDTLAYRCGGVRCDLLLRQPPAWQCLRRQGTRGRRSVMSHGM